MIGEFAVTWGNAKLEGALGEAQDQALGLLRKVGVAPAEDQPDDDDEAEAPDTTGTGSEAATESHDQPSSTPEPEATGQADDEADVDAATPNPLAVAFEPPTFDGPDDEGDDDSDTDDESDIEPLRSVGATLAIPDYDNLSASQVVPRLDGLTPAELESVRRYEKSHRHRNTILSRIAQLQTAAD